MKPLDKKQIPQVIALAVLAVAFFGYFAMKMILPTPAAAGTQPSAAAPTSKPSVKKAEAAVDATAFTAPAPTPGMHDPFVQAISDQPAPAAPAAPPKTTAPSVRTASLKVTGIAPLAIPSVPGLPPATIREQKSAAIDGVTTGIPALPAAPSVPAAPSWTVTGVLQSGAEHVAILRSGDARRFVKQGDFVDSQFAVEAVTRDSVVLRHGHSRFTLPLGGSKAAPSGAARATPASGPTADPTQGAASQETAPDGKPQPKGTKSATPDIARLPAPHTARRMQVIGCRSLFSFPSEGSSALADVSQMARRAVCPRVRVAAYQSGKASPLFSADGFRGLLPAGTEAPDFSLATVSGETFSLSQFQGRVVVLDFWASWHAPSVRSLAALTDLQNDLGSQGLSVLAVNSWDSKDGMRAALQGFAGGATQLYDPSVSNASVAVSLYRVPDVPTFYVIDQEGRVAGAFVGYGRNTTSYIKATLAKLGIVSQEKTL